MQVLNSAIERYRHHTYATISIE